MQQQGLFSNYKYCEYCGRPLSLDFDGTVCPGCKDHMLFREVKEYIRANDVTEYDVAQYFNIPLSQVKLWIKQGRIEYKEKPNKPKAIVTHCKECGAPISFGILCTKCLRRQDVSGHSKITKEDPGRMRYFEE